MKHKNRIQYADDDTESVDILLKIRFPSLLLGLGMGIVISFATSRFEEVLTNNVRLVFFLPFIVYMDDAISTQTQSIYARNLKIGRPKFYRYLIKESSIGLLLGIIFGSISGLVTHWWF